MFLDLTKALANVFYHGGLRKVELVVYPSPYTNQYFEDRTQELQTRDFLYDTVPDE